MEPALFLDCSCVEYLFPEHSKRKSVAAVLCCPRCWLTFLFSLSSCGPSCFSYDS